MNNLNQSLLLAVNESEDLKNELFFKEILEAIESGRLDKHQTKRILHTIAYKWKNTRKEIFELQQIDRMSNAIEDIYYSNLGSVANITKDEPE